MAPAPPSPYKLQTTPTVRRQLAEELPEAVAVAALEFITGPLLDSPYRIGRRLSPPLDDRYSARRGTYRVLYRIDDHAHIVTVVLVSHRRDAYRSRESPQAGHYLQDNRDDRHARAREPVL